MLDAAPVRSPLRLPLAPTLPIPPGTQERYQDAVRKALDAIGRGDTYQVNLAWGLGAPCPDPMAAFEALLQHNPAWRASFLRWGDLSVVSNSPECFLQARRQGGALRVRSSPIKGTASRSTCRRGRLELLTSPKEQA